MVNCISAWGKEEGGNTQRGKYSEVFKIRNSPEKTNSRGSFPAQEYRGNAELNHQVRVLKQTNKMSPGLNTVKILLMSMVLSKAWAMGRVFSTSLFPAAKALRAVQPWDLS